jgi:hypothetical protein
MLTGGRIFSFNEAHCRTLSRQTQEILGSGTETSDKHSAWTPREFFLQHDAPGSSELQGVDTFLLRVRKTNDGYAA